jgi:poly(3-hydroxybutyrate) depolymerase
MSTVHATYAYAGAEREYWLHSPSCIGDAHGRPLVLMLHGWTETGGKYAGLNGGWHDLWAEEADRGNFYVVWPQGLRTELGTMGMTSSWNAGGCSSAGAQACASSTVLSAYYGGPFCSRSCADCSDAACAWCSCADDLGFLVSLVRTLIASRELHVDASRIYVAGCSNGGMMAFDLAMHGPPGLFAAFVTNCGSPHPGHECTPSLLHPQLHIHATNDPVIPIDGSPAADGGWRFTPAADALAAVERASACVEQPVAWAWLNDLRAGAPAAESAEDAGLPWLRGWSFADGVDSTSNISDGRCHLRASCTDDVQTVLCTGEFGHDWPPWSAAVAWRFLRRFRAPEVEGSGGATPPPPAMPPVSRQCPPWKERNTSDGIINATVPNPNPGAPACGVEPAELGVVSDGILVLLSCCGIVLLAIWVARRFRRFAAARPGKQRRPRRVRAGKHQQRLPEVSEVSTLAVEFTESKISLPRGRGVA